MFLVYRVTNTLNGKFYIGAHEGVPDDGYMGSGRLVKRAIQKYGRNSFEKTILQECSTREEMFAYERQLVTAELVGRNDTYNACVGGYGGPRPGSGNLTGRKPNLGHKHSPEARQKMSLSQLARFANQTTEEREKMRQCKRGKASHTTKHTPESIEKMRQSHKLQWARRKEMVA